MSPLVNFTHRNILFSAGTQIRLYMSEHECFYVPLKPFPHVSTDVHMFCPELCQCHLFWTTGTFQDWHVFAKTASARDCDCPLQMSPCIKCLPGRQSTKRTHSYSVFGSSPAHMVKSYRQRAVAVQKIVRHHEGEGSRNTEVGYEANEQRGHDANRNGSLWVFHFLTCDVEQKLFRSDIKVHAQ